MYARCKTVVANVPANSTFVVATSQSQFVTFNNITRLGGRDMQSTVMAKCLSEEREVELIDMWQARPVLYEVISKEH